MKPDFNRLIDRRDSDSIKWNLFEEDVLPLWVADMDFPAPPEVLNAVKTRVDHGVFGYSKTQESTLKSIQDWLKNRHGWEVAIESIVLLPGVVQSFNFAARAFSNPGDSILIQTPAYHPFFQVHEHANIEVEINALVRDGNGKYVLDPQRFKQDLKPNTRMFMLCNPHNPSGRVFSRSELEMMAQYCIDNNTLICSDEIHSDLIYPPHKHIPIASLSEEIANRTITLISPSKTFNIAGLKSSAAIISNPRLRDLFNQSRSGFSGSVNVLGETALEAAYRECAPWLETLITYLENNLSYLSDFISAEIPAISFYPPEGTYLAWLDCSKIGLTDPGDFLLENARVGLNAGTWFGSNYQQFVRMNFACPKDLLARALERMKKALVTN